jgi:hypothetical protein
VQDGKADLAKSAAAEARKMNPKIILILTEYNLYLETKDLRLYKN